MTNFDDMKLAVEALSGGKNTVVLDDVNMPSVMVRIPKFLLSNVIDGATAAAHPAFIINDTEKDCIMISKFQNIVVNNRAYSLPYKDPEIYISTDNARIKCENKGNGWHLMSAAEWGAIALWCKKNKFLPYGNTYYGKDFRESVYSAIPAYTDSSGKTCSIATGSGPVTWTHNNQPDGICDLSGNVWEECDGIRLHYGELQIMKSNDCADRNNSKEADSPNWKAINGMTGELIFPDGSGTTENSLKLDFVSSKWKWTIGENITKRSDTQLEFKTVTADDSIHISAKEMLNALILLPDDASFNYEEDVTCAATNASYRAGIYGGAWRSKNGAGIFTSNFNRSATYTQDVIGFRSAYYE